VNGETSERQCYAVSALTNPWITSRRMVIVFEVDEKSLQAAYV